MSPAARSGLFSCGTAAILTILALSARADATEPGLPAAFTARTIPVADDVEIFVQVGGSGRPVVLLHGYVETGDMWGPLAAELAKTRTVIVPDLRGIGRSSHPSGGYDKKTEARDVRTVVTKLGFDSVSVVGHDIGLMVAYAYAAQYPTSVDRLVVMDAPLPGVAPWTELLKSRGLWHFSFGGPDAERLVEGRERVYFDRFWNDFSADPRRIGDATRDHFAAQYAKPGGMRAGFAQFAAFETDAQDNAGFQRTKLTMPVLAVGGEKSFGSTMTKIMESVATDVRGVVVPDAGHWLMEEKPEAVVRLVREFLEETTPPPAERRIAPSEFDFATARDGGTGTSNAAGIRVVTLKGDPTRAGLYTILLRVPPRTRIAAHTHRDDRVATVVSGTWYFGYGERFDETALKALPPGSWYTEPPGRAHFAETRDEAAMVQITGFGPSTTQYVDEASDPRPAR